MGPFGGLGIEPKNRQPCFSVCESYQRGLNTLATGPFDATMTESTKGLAPPCGRALFTIVYKLEFHH